MATSSAVTAWISAPKARSRATSLPCASASKTALRSRVEFRFATKANRTRSRISPSQPRLPRPWLPRPARNWQAERLGKNKGHARACLFCFIVWIFTLVQDATSEDLERTADADVPTPSFGRAALLAPRKAGQEIGRAHV